MFLEAQTILSLAKAKAARITLDINPVISAQRNLDQVSTQLADLFISDWGVKTETFNGGFNTSAFSLCYAVSIVVNHAMVNGFSLNTGANPVMELRVGERMETVIKCRSDGVYGRYIGGQEYDHIVVIDNVFFGINRFVEGDVFWTVKNLLTGKQIDLPEQYSLASLTWV
jgi:hypothetical protein